MQNAVSGLRKVLFGATGADGASLTTRPPGYPPCRTDLHPFQDLRTRGDRALGGGRPGEASGLLHRALASWRGPALADLREAGLQWPELQLLEEWRLATLENRVQADLLLGRYRELIGELSEAAIAHRCGKGCTSS